MEVTFAPKEKAWRGPGRPRRQIPAQVQAMADHTYRTGQVGIVTVGPDDEDHAAELVRLLKSYAKSCGRGLRIQRDEGQIRFLVTDRKKKVA